MSAPQNEALDRVDGLLGVRFLYANSPPNLELLRSQLAAALPQAKVSTNEADVSFVHIAHLSHVFEFKDGSAPAQAVVFAPQTLDAARLSDALSQARGWPQVSDVVGRCSHELIVTELMARHFEPRLRLALFNEVVSRLQESAPPEAIHSVHADRLFEPAAYLADLRSPDEATRFFTSSHVRLFRVDGARGNESIMDTRGLPTFGIPDLQIHFSGLEANAVARQLYNIAYYLFTEGDCLETGHTIEGLDPSQAWRCQREISLAPPRREVIDLDPGPPFAAGNRRR